jgi:cathepsin L
VEEMSWKLVIVCFLTVKVAGALELGEEWALWKNQHRMSYSSEDEEAKRYSIWLSNKKYIDEHNSKNLSFVLRMNKFGDLTLEEYSDSYACHLVGDNSINTNEEMYKPPKDVELPTAINWRNENKVTAIKAQGEYRCHSCYAFAAVGALESHHAIITGSKTRLSEQNIIDCSAEYGNAGCEGGNYRTVYKYIIENQGIDTQSSYPYKALKNNCKFNSNKVGATMSSVLHIERGSESDLQSAVALEGPVVVSIDHRHQSFQFYGGGIYSEYNCYTNYYLLTHEMIVVGYGTNQYKDYWIIKNSYGSSWGRGGYMWMARGQNNCGIASDAAFPVI